MRKVAIIFMGNHVLGYLTRGLEKVNGELALMAIAYDLARSMTLLGFVGLLEAVSGKAAAACHGGEPRDYLTRTRPCPTNRRNRQDGRAGLAQSGFLDGLGGDYTL